MSQLRFASVLITAGVGFAGPAHALANYHAPGGGTHGVWGGGGMHAASRPKMKSAMPASGCCGGHMGTPGGHKILYGGKPALGMHPMGMHFYGMGGGASGGHAYGMGGHETHAPLGTHLVGLHFYGMSGGGLAKYYGHLEHEMPAGQGYGYRLGGESGYGYGGAKTHQPKSYAAGYGGAGYGSAYPSKVRGSGGYGYAFHESYRVKAAFRYSYGFKPLPKPSSGGSGKWKAPASYPLY